MRKDFNVTTNWLAQEFPDLQNIRHLSRGGQKQVFSATHSKEGDVVLKLINPSADMERTTRELVAVARVRSARVPAIRGQGLLETPIGPCYWFREDRVHGETLRERLAHGALGRADLLRLALQLSETLAQAEAVSIVHRDVKPENVIVDLSGQFWLIDFGLARHLGLESLTATAAAFGNVTWGYAPLEQCRNIKQEIDARADLFALGVTLYECATGINPFHSGARDALEVLKRVENTPRLLLPDDHGSEFCDLVAALTQRQRVHRPGTAREAHDWIQEIDDQGLPGDD